MNVDDTELYTDRWLRWWILWYVCLTTIKRKRNKYLYFSNPTKFLFSLCPHFACITVIIIQVLLFCIWIFFFFYSVYTTTFPCSYHGLHVFSGCRIFHHAARSQCPQPSPCYWIFRLFLVFYVYRQRLPFMVFCLWNSFDTRNLPVGNKGFSQWLLFKENTLKI